MYVSLHFHCFTADGRYFSVSFALQMFKGAVANVLRGSGAAIVLVLYCEGERVMMLPAWLIVFEFWFWTHEKICLFR